MINIVIPMAGEGRRFKEAGYRDPKPFIDVSGMPMIEMVLSNLRVQGSQFICIAQRKHMLDKKDIFHTLSKRYSIRLIGVDGLTEGPTCTVLHAVRYINNDEPLMIANSDQMLDVSVQNVAMDCKRRKLDGSMMTFPADHEKWSYAKIDDEGYVTEVAEKKVISTHATAGIYYWSQGKVFVESAVEMMSHNERIHNEFYVAPSYNYAIARGFKIGIYEIHESQMHGLGTPDDLHAYLSKVTEQKRAFAV